MCAARSVVQRHIPSALVQGSHMATGSGSRLKPSAKDRRSDMLGRDLFSQLHRLRRNASEFAEQDNAPAFDSTLLEINRVRVLIEEPARIAQRNTDPIRLH
jgi:hypothetical protein